MTSAILEKISRLDPASALEEESVAMSATGMAYAGEKWSPFTSGWSLAHRTELQLVWTR